MQKLVIKGGKPLNGKVEVGGAKNAALPILAATILAEGTFCISNVPKLRDICTMSLLLEKLGVYTACDLDSRFCDCAGFNGSEEKIGANKLCYSNKGGELYEAPYDLVKTMRASILVLGPLLAKRKRAKVSLPGGCAIGERPVDLHISALEKMGATIKLHHGYIEASCERLEGAEIDFRTVTVTGTENIMMAATLAEGTTILNNAAKEPEVVDLAKFLRSMGANIKGEGTEQIIIEGVENLNAVNYSVMPDRIEAGTLLCAVAGAGGCVEVKGVPIEEMKAVLDSLRAAGVGLTILNDDTIRVESNGKLNAVDITTMPYPGFPTDMQAQFMAVMTKAEGTCVINETIFENRFMHVAELKRMGAEIILKDNKAVVKGVSSLSGAPVMASDLRASAGLVIAGLMAENTSEVLRVYHLDRGYENFEVKLSSIGADIKRVSSNE